MKKFNILIVALFLCNQLIGQSLYDLNTIQTIEITFAQSNWDQILDTEANGNEGYTMAQNVTINGTAFDSVGVKYKGNSTYNANQAKNPFHIELDTYKSQDYQGYKDIKLSNVAKDPSFLREVLSYQVLGQYMHAPLSNFANVYVNGTLIGLYSNSESITKVFVSDRFGSKKNTFVKCNPPAGAGPQATDLPSLEYLGEDSTAYYDAYELKSDTGWDELIDLCDTLVNHIGDIEAILDVDRALWMLAFDNVLVNLDSYIGGFQQNYYLYRDNNGRFNTIVWDLNESFGRFAMTGSGNLNSTTQKQQMSHLLHSNDATFPLIQKLLGVPMYKRMYLAHVKTMLKENFENESYYDTGLELQNLIDADVLADNNKFFTYANFQTNLTSDINGGGGGGGGGGSTPGITNLMNGRAAYLLGLNDFTQTEPTISDINFSVSTPVINESFSITASVTNASRAYLGFRTDEEDRFIRMEMFDDGAHNDGAAGDGVFGVDLSTDNAFNQYYIYGENDNIGKFSPARAEHEYHVFTATSSMIVLGDLVINEFMASNTTTQEDQDGEFDDWIELFNNGNSPINLEGYFLSDDLADPMKWVFPAGWTIEAGGYMIIWADEDQDQEGLHCNFKLSAGGESISLSDAEEVLLDEVVFTEQTEDVSTGRFPNGVGDFQTMNPTFDGENMGTVGTADLDASDLGLAIFPNPTNDYIEITIESEDLQNRTVEIFNLQGVKIFEGTIREKLGIETSDWIPGLYIIGLEGVYQKLSKL